MNPVLLALKSILFFQLWIVTALGLVSYGYDHTHPTPTLPKNIDPATVTDIFSIHAIIQIHSTLFTIGDSQMPVPELVSEFSVDSDQRRYRFKLKQLSFHNGKPLTVQHVQRSIERTIKMGTPGAERFAKVKGYQDLVKRKAKTLRGFVKVDSLQFHLELDEPDRFLIYTLADPRFSILENFSRPEIGLGMYALQSKGKNEWVLRRFRAPQSAPDRVIFKQAEQADAMKAYLAGKYHDLFSYVFTPEVRTQITFEQSNVQEIHAPRTYLFALNSARLGSSESRRQVIDKVDAEDLIKLCYAGSRRTYSYIPPGFPGHVSEALTSEVQGRRASPRQDLEVLIADGIGNESCVVNYLRKQMPGARIKIVDTDQLTQAWQARNKVDLIFLYMEGEISVDLLDFVDPAAGFTLYLTPDAQFQKLLSQYRAKTDLMERNKLAADANRYLYEKNLLFPLFHPINVLIYHKRYARIPGLVRSSTFIRYDQLDWRGAN